MSTLLYNTAIMMRRRMTKYFSQLPKLLNKSAAYIRCDFFAYIWNQLYLKCMLFAVCAPAPRGVVWKTKWRFHSILAVAKMPNPTLLQNKSEQHCFCLSICQFYFCQALNWTLAYQDNQLNDKNSLYEHIYVGRVVFSCQKQSLCYFWAWHDHNCLISQRK